MLMFKLFKKKALTEEEKDAIELSNFFDEVAPNTIQFFTDYYICGNTYRSIWAIVGYIFSTDSQALLSDLATQTDVTIHVIPRALYPSDEHRIIANADRKNKNGLFSKKTTEVIDSSEDTKELALMLKQKRKLKEPLLDVSIYIEAKADSLENLQRLQEDIKHTLAAEKIEVDKMFLMQKEGFLALMPGGKLPESKRNKRVLPASSVANLFPLAYTGKIDENGFRLGKDKYGGDIIVDLDKRAEDKTNGNCIILGNPGEGKSYLAKQIKLCLLESGKNVIVIDPSGEYRDLTEKMGGAYVDISGYIINPLEIRQQAVDDESDVGDETDASEGIISRHISFLRDFFYSYKQYNQSKLDIIEILLRKLYDRYDITDATPYPSSGKWPVISELYSLAERIFLAYEDLTSQSVLPFSKEDLRDVMLSINSICQGSDSKYFNGETNIPDGRLVTFGFKQLLDTNANLLNATLHNALSYMNNQIQTIGNTAGIIDELHLFLGYQVAVNYIRSMMKQARKKDSLLVLATQNIEDMMLPGIKELTKPLFTIPTHVFIFYPGAVNKREFIDLTSLTPEEFQLIQNPHRGSCLYKCGAERFLLQVEAPEHKALLIGNSGGR